VHADTAKAVAERQPSLQCFVCCEMRLRCDSVDRGGVGTDTHESERTFGLTDTSGVSQSPQASRRDQPLHSGYPETIAASRCLGLLSGGRRPARHFQNMELWLRRAYFAGFGPKECEPGLQWKPVRGHTIRRDRGHTGWESGDNRVLRAR
jgi:hypothetical protein